MTTTMDKCDVKIARIKIMNDEYERKKRRTKCKKFQVEAAAAIYHVSNATRVRLLLLYTHPHIAMDFDLKLFIQCCHSIVRSLCTSCTCYKIDSEWL